MTLRGPAHPDTFRVQVGRYGDRWYHDPLPSCDIAPATDDSWPSVSIVKGAWPKDLGRWHATEAARFAVEQHEKWLPLIAAEQEQAAIDMIAGASDRSRNKAADRGTEVHRLLEMIADGNEPHEALIPDAAAYLDSLRQLVADLRPEWIYSEAVCISRSLGYGGTADAVIRVADDVPEIGGKVLAVDWKTRKAGRHDAYREECAQLAAYDRCDYLIVERGGQACRALPPQTDGGLIVSITPDDYRLYPVDMDAAWDSYRDLRRFFDTTKKKIRGKHIVVPRRILDKPPAPVSPTDPFDGLVPAAPVPLPGAGGGVEAEGDGPLAVSLASPGRIEWATTRTVRVIEADTAQAVGTGWWPVGVPSFREARETGHALTDDEVDAISAALHEPERALGLSFYEVDDPGRSDAPPPVDRTPPPAPPRPVTVAGDDPRIDALVARLRALPLDLVAEIEAEMVTVQKRPNLRSGRATEADVALVDALLGPLEMTAADRHHRITIALSLLQANGVEPITALELIGAGSADRLTEWEAEALDDLAVAVAGGAVFSIADGRISMHDGAETALVNAHGGKRQIVAAAKQIAGRRGWTPPRSTADVLAQPLLAAAVAVSDRVADPAA